MASTGRTAISGVDDMRRGQGPYSRLWESAVHTTEERSSILHLRTDATVALWHCSEEDASE